MIWWILGIYAAGIPLSGLVLGIIGEADDIEEWLGPAAMWPLLLLVGVAFFLPAAIGSFIRSKLARGEAP